MSASSDYILVAALDFGTTYSGYAYSLRHEFKVDPLKIQSNQVWGSGGRALLSLKTLTCLLLDDEKKFVAFGFEAENKYAEIVLDKKQDDYFYFHRFKMNLHNNKNVTSNMILEDIRGKPVLAIDVFSLSIKAMVDHLMETLRRRVSSIKIKDIRWVLTVPAIWTDAAKLFMRKSAEKAGIPEDKLFLALEAEAASIFCQHLPTDKLHEIERGFTILEPGTKYMVVDLGGGTVDITVHEKTADGYLRELRRGTGGDCGGASVDGEFFQMLVKIFGGPLMKSLIDDDLSAYLDLIREFEAVKRHVEPLNSNKVNVTIPYVSIDLKCQQILGERLDSVIQSSSINTQVSLLKDKMRIDASVMVNFFQPAIANIISLMREVLSDRATEEVNTILLVGGFAECRLVQDSIKRAFEDKRLIIPIEAGLAVLRGAVIFGHNPDYVQSRVMRLTYGIQTSDPFDKYKHDQKYLEVIDGEERCKSIFAKFIQKNQVVVAGLTIRKEFSTIKNFQTDMILPVYISTCENPLFTDEDGCVKLCELVLNLPNPCEGKRWVDIEFTFGKTEIGIKATDRNSLTQISTNIDII